MRVLIAEDDRISRRLLGATLSRLDYEVVETENGEQAFELLSGPDAPRLAVLDWMMPRMDGIEVCRRLRAREDLAYCYVVFLTARGQVEDIVAGLEAGADDYLVKPFNPYEINSRLAVGRRILQLQDKLTTKVDELEQALGHVQQLQGLLPICMHCKKIRDDDASWHRIESYLEKYGSFMFTHSLCHECLEEHYPQHA